MGSKIDRYISGLFWFYFIGGLLVFVTIFVAIDALSTLVSYKQAAPTALIKYYAYGMPEVIYRMTPVACLLATIFAISTLNRNNELVALYSVGMGLVRITFPIMFWVALISVATFFISDRIMPSFARNKNFVFPGKLRGGLSFFMDQRP